MENLAATNDILKSLDSIMVSLLAVKTVIKAQQQLITSMSNYMDEQEKIISGLLDESIKLDGRVANLEVCVREIASNRKES